MKKDASSQAAWALLIRGVAEARTEAHRLRHLVNRGLKIAEASEQKEHLYAIAGDLLVGMPKRLGVLERVLDRTSYALSVMGSEFFESRLAIPDRELVEEAVKHSQQPFPGSTKRSSAHKVATRYLARLAVDSEG